MFLGITEALAGLKTLSSRAVKTSTETVNIMSLGENLSGILHVPEVRGRAPALIICHGAGEFKENYLELCQALALRGVASLALDMHGHGESDGEPFQVEMREWVADVQSAIGFLQRHPKIDGERIGAFGLSSGGTAILEAALVDSRLKTLIVLDATVRNSLPIFLSVVLKFLVLVGRIKKRLTNRDLRVPLAKMGKFHLAADPELDRRLSEDPRGLAAFMNFPFPGGAEAFFVDTLKRVAGIRAPTLVIWGEEDRLDPPETARLLHDALTCEKQLHIIPGNGHVGHLDRNKEKVFVLTADWAEQKLGHAPAQ